MSSRSFEQEWKRKVASVRRSSFWREVSRPAKGRLEPPARRRRGEVLVDDSWTLLLEGDITDSGPAAVAAQDLRQFLHQRLGISVRSKLPAVIDTSPRVIFALTPARSSSPSRWDGSFSLIVEPTRITVRAATESALLRASLYLSNYWSLRRSASLPLGRRRVRPAVPLHVGADLWGGFCTTQAWIHGRESDDNFLELARMGINAVPIMTLIEDYLEPDLAGPFRDLANPNARANRMRLAQLARSAARHGVYIMLMGYNPKLDPKHPLFARNRRARGALQSGDSFRTLCTSDPRTRQFLVDSWASLFTEIHELGGIVAITGGEGFYHCFMRSRNRAADCPRCSRRQGSEVVAEFVNDVARGIRGANPEAVLTTWPYSAGHWSGDRDQVDYIEALDPDHVIFQTEIDKDSVDWRPAGYAKNIWDYSMSKVTVSERCRRQRRLCADLSLPFSVKLEIGNSIECLNVPYLPTLENQRAIWENARRLRPRAIHSRWLFDGSCKSPSEELGFWAIWGRNTEFADLDLVLTAVAERDFGREAAPFVRRGWRCFSEGMRHHPQLAYYVGSYFIGPGQPLVLDPKVSGSPRPAGAGRTSERDAERLDPAFFGRFYWQWENSVTGDDDSLVHDKPLFFASPGFRAVSRRGPSRGRDVALEELQALADLWEQGVRQFEKAEPAVSRARRPRFQREMVIARHLAYTWRSAANVEEFLRLRDTIREFSGQSWVRSGHRRENLRDLDRMGEIAEAEAEIARLDLELVAGVDYLDLSLRLDMGTASTEAILKAKIRQVKRLIDKDLPLWRESLVSW